MEYDYRCNYCGEKNADRDSLVEHLATCKNNVEHDTVNDLIIEEVYKMKMALNSQQPTHEQILQTIGSNRTYPIKFYNYAVDVLMNHFLVLSDGEKEEIKKEYLLLSKKPVS